jgi:hypothetical protein
MLKPFAAGIGASFARRYTLVHVTDAFAVFRALRTGFRAFPAGVLVMGVLTSMKWADVRHISAQAIIRRK